MHYHVALCAVIVISITSVAANCVQDALKNTYCSAVQAMKYSGFPGTGTYGKVTLMDKDTYLSKACASELYTYSGSLSPLDEEVSWHMRGPFHLKQFAVYTPGSSYSKRNLIERHHGHQHVHERDSKKAKHHEHGFGLIHGKRAVGDLVTATFTENGVTETITFVNTYAGSPTSANSAEGTTKFIAYPTASIGASRPSSFSSVKTVVRSSVSSSTSVTPSFDTGSGGWIRQAYFNADGSGTVDGLVFLNHNGTPGISGTFDYMFGSSLSYAASDPFYPSSSPQVLADAMIDDGIEVVIMSDKSCSDGSCGYTRPNAQAFHGFGGSDKAFLVEFSMPLTGKRGINMDMPSVWILNAQVPNTLQYGNGNPSCSCWPGCGELDVFEILVPGDTRCTSSLHLDPGNGSSDYFPRPTNGTVKVAVVFSGSDVNIQILDDNQTFDSTLSSSTIGGFCNVEKAVKAVSNVVVG